LERWLQIGVAILVAGHTTTTAAAIAATVIMAAEHIVAGLGVDHKQMQAIADNFALAPKTADLLITGVGSFHLHHTVDSQ
jgi:hypothetical protein